MYNVLLAKIWSRPNCLQADLRVLWWRDVRFESGWDWASIGWLKKPHSGILAPLHIDGVFTEIGRWRWCWHTLGTWVENEEIDQVVGCNITFYQSYHMFLLTLCIPNFDILEVWGCCKYCQIPIYRTLHSYIRNKI